MPVALNAPSVPLKAKLFRGLADPSRLSILEALREGARSVGELVQATGLTQSNTSNHLACLLDCGLVEREQQGRRVIYQLGEGVDTLLVIVDELLSETASGVEACGRYEAAPVPLRAADELPRREA
ncbi:MAG TPA: metalloregulator ArsR/SmtB family transcription factor [Longimicrobiaceae bacterium]|nr:metalloregulator ArsR/SmtB family transcription factor [Longimicrobiaceae bacterium]